MDGIEKPHGENCTCAQQIAFHGIHSSDVLDQLLDIQARRNLSFKDLVESFMETPEVSKFELSTMLATALIRFAEVKLP